MDINGKSCVTTINCNKAFLPMNLSLLKVYTAKMDTMTAIIVVDEHTMKLFIKHLRTTD